MTNLDTKTYFESYVDKRPVLDVRMLILINVIASSVVLISNSLTLLISAFLVSEIAMLLFRMYKPAFYYALFFLSVVITVLYVSQTKPSKGLFIFLNVISLFLFMFGKILPFVMIAHIILKQMHVNYLVSSLRKLHLHRGLLLSLIVAIRYLPTAKQEFKTIKNAMRLRGIELSAKTFFNRPLDVIEFSLVPLLFKNVAVADEMSAAATVKGIEYKGTQSSLIDIKLSALDYIFALFSIILIVPSYLKLWNIETFFAQLIGN